MKRIPFLIVFASLMLFAFGTAQGAIEITLDEMTNILGSATSDTVEAGKAVRFTFRLTYTPGTNDSLTEFTNGFQVWAHQNGVNTDNFAAITYDTFSWGWPDMFDLVFRDSGFSIDGVGADTIGIVGAKMFGSGIVAPFDEQVWWIETTPTIPGDTLCIDSAFYPPGGQWLWSTTAGRYCDIPTGPGWCPAGMLGWDGPHCFHVAGGAADNLLVDSSSLTFEVVEGTGADTSTIRITSSGGAAKAELDFTLTPNDTWLKFDTAGGTGPNTALAGMTPMDVFVIADFTGMDTGQYTATITVTSTQAGNTPFDIPTGMSVGTGVAVDGTENLPTSYALSQNYPNPFNPNTEIKFDIPVRSHVTLTVFNVLGQRVATLVDKEMPPGSYVADWNSTSDNGKEVTSGVYFYKLEADDFIQTKKMLLLT